MFNYDNQISQDGLAAAGGTAPLRSCDAPQRAAEAGLEAAQVQCLERILQLAETGWLDAAEISSLLEHFAPALQQAGLVCTSAPLLPGGKATWIASFAVTLI